MCCSSEPLGIFLSSFLVYFAELVQSQVKDILYH